jgi:hypothetical protein
VATQPSLLFGVGVCVLFVIVNNRAQYRCFARDCGIAVALAAIPLDLVSYVFHGFGIVCGCFLREVIGELKPYPTVETFSEVGVRRWPPVLMKRLTMPDRA